MPCARRTEQTSLNIQINSRSLVCDMLSLVLQGYSSKFCHFAHGALMDFGIEERRTAIEAIATLAHMKNALADLILRPAGVPPEVFRPLLYQRDPNTGRALSKRQLAPIVLDAIDGRPGCTGVVRAIIEIAAAWKSFHLAADEFAARATVQKAREILGQVQTMDAREAAQRELARKEEITRLERERAEQFEKHSELLMNMFDHLATSSDHQQRGYLLQDLLGRLFDLHRIPVVRSFVRNERGEQIDGAFKLEGWHYLVECRWRERLADIRELDGLKGQVDRSGAMGLFLGINGWSENVPKLLKQNPDKSIVLMDGFDVRTVLARRLDLSDFLLAKVARLKFEAEPFLSVKDYLVEEGSA